MKVVEVVVSGIAMLVTIMTFFVAVGCSEAVPAADDGAQNEVVIQREDQVGPTQSPETPTPEAAEEPRQVARAETPERSERGRESTRREPRQRAIPAPRQQPSETSRREEPNLQPEIAETEGISLRSVVMARDVADRTPVGAATSFSVEEGDRIYAFLDVANPEREERALSVVWAHVESPEDELSRVEVQVGPSPRWRTWAYTSRLNRPGRYLAIVRDHDGEVIARAPFDVTL